MHLSLDADIQRFIEEQVRAGQYASPEDVVADAITRLRNENLQEPDEETWAKIDQADAEFDAGKNRPIDEVAAELRKKYLDHGARRKPRHFE